MRDRAGDGPLDSATDDREAPPAGVVRPRRSGDRSFAGASGRAASRPSAKAAAGRCNAARRAQPDGLVNIELKVDVPVQFFQSVIAIELAVTGALLWQMRFFETDAKRESERLPDARIRLALAVVLGATLFGSLWGIADEGPKWAGVAVTIGVAISLVPILLRVLPPLAKDAATNERDPHYAITILGLVLYVAVVASVLVLLDVE